MRGGTVASSGTDTTTSASYPGPKYANKKLKARGTYCEKMRKVESILMHFYHKYISGYGCQKNKTHELVGHNVA